VTCEKCAAVVRVVNEGAKTMVRRKRGPSPAVIARVDQMLAERGHGRRCPRHPRRLARLGVLWADGRATWFSCGRPCLSAWKKEHGRMAEVVRVIPVNTDLG